jgi:hypothetical protein
MSACRRARLWQSVQVPPVDKLADAQGHQAEADQDGRIKVGLRRVVGWHGGPQRAAAHPHRSGWCNYGFAFATLRTSVNSRSSANSPLPTS